MSSEQPAAANRSTAEPGPGTDERVGLTPTSPEARRPDAPSLPTEAPRIPGYELLELLGRGGMGAVYKARHLHLKKLVAIKLLPLGWGEDSQAVARFHREIEALGILSHPNVIAATDAGEVNSLPFLVMEFVDGLTLTQVVQRIGPLTIADACEAVRQAAVGLQYIHEHGRVHRDLKPSNLMLSADGTVKILDLGLALLGNLAQGQELTPSRQAMGTPDYMAPEQWEDSRRVDIRADLYSLGCTLYKLLTGEPPFGGSEYDSAFKKMGAHVHAAVPPLHLRRPDVPPALEAVAARLLAKSPTDRYPTPAALAEALRPFTLGADLCRLNPSCQQLATPPAPPQTAALVTPPAVTLSLRTGNRHWRFLLLAATLLLLITAGLTAWFWPQPFGPRPGPTSPQEPTSSQEEAKRLAPGVWHDLLEHQPVALDWPVSNRNSSWTWGENTHELHAICARDGLLQLGTTEADTYTVEMNVYQTSWGGIGFFFGRGPDPGPNNPGGTRHQVVVLVQGQEVGRDGLWLTWTTCRTSARGGSALEEVARVYVGRLQARDHKLSLSVAGGTLRAVCLDGREIPGLLEAAAAGGRRPPPGPHYRGAFGLAIIHSQCFIRNVRYLFEGTP